MTGLNSTRRQFLHWAASAGAGWALAQPAAAETRPPSRPFRPLPPARWAYTVQAQMRGIPLKAEARMAWAHDGQRYQASSEFEAPFLGTRRQTSIGRITAQGLLPERFTDESRRQRSVEFDHAGAQVRYSPGSGTSHSAPLPTGVQDRLSLFLQLAGWMAGHAATQPDAAPTGTLWTLPVTGRSNAAPWTFEWLPSQTLVVPAGKATAWGVRRQPRDAGDETLEIWLVPAWGFAPARIQIREAGGDVVDQVLTQRL